MTSTAVMVLVIDPIRYCAVEARCAARAAGPHRAVAVEDGTDHGGQAALGLGDVEQPLPLVTHGGDPTVSPANASGGGQAQTRLRSP